MFTLFTIMIPGTDWAGRCRRATKLMAELGRSVAWYFVAYVLVVAFVMTNARDGHPRKAGVEDGPERRAESLRAAVGAMAPGHAH